MFNTISFPPSTSPRVISFAYAAACLLDTILFTSSAILCWRLAFRSLPAGSFGFVRGLKGMFKGEEGGEGRKKAK